VPFAWVVSRVCEEFHLPVSQALRELAMPDLDEFDAVTVAEESAALMFEIMDYRAFAEARRAYEAAKPEDQSKLAKDHRMVALVQEMVYEAGIAKVRERKARQRT